MKTSQNREIKPSQISAPSPKLQKYLYAKMMAYQILTGTVMKYHVSVDCQESYIFPIKDPGLYFPEVCSTEGKYCPEGKYNYLGTTDTWYFIRPGRYLLY